MKQYESTIKITHQTGSYETKVSYWAKDDNEARKYIKKHFPLAAIIKL